jgi:hypothetical protein
LEQHEFEKNLDNHQSDEFLALTRQEQLAIAGAQQMRHSVIDVVVIDRGQIDG